MFQLFLAGGPAIPPDTHITHTHTHLLFPCNIFLCFGPSMRLTLFSSTLVIDKRSRSILHSTSFNSACADCGETETRTERESQNTQVLRQCLSHSHCLPLFLPSHASSLSVLISSPGWEGKNIWAFKLAARTNKTVFSYSMKISMYLHYPNVVHSVC